VGTEFNPHLFELLIGAGKFWK